MTTEKKTSAVAVLPPPTIEALAPTVSLKEYLARIEDFRTFVHQGLREGVDFGSLPVKAGGRKGKNFLQKPGAERICMYYNLEPIFDFVDRVDQFDPPLFYYLARCTLIHRGTGRSVGQGMGSATSRESKYRYRRVYWNDKKNDPPADEKWEGGRNDRGAYFYRDAENEDAADIQNTILKMALKRAHIDATLRVSAASEYFTQDLDDRVEAEEERDRTEPAQAAHPKDPAAVEADFRKRLAEAKNAGAVRAIGGKIALEAETMRETLLPAYEAKLRELGITPATRKGKAVAPPIVGTATGATDPASPKVDAAEASEPGPCSRTVGCGLPDKHQGDCILEGDDEDEDPADNQDAEAI